MATQKDYRHKTLGAIHAIKKALHMDDDVYRDALKMRFPNKAFNDKPTAAELSQTELNQWLLHLKSLQKRAGLNTEGVRNEAMINKCEALWIELRKAGAVQDGSKAALESFVKNSTGAAALRMASGKQLYQAIEALKSWLARVQKKGLNHAD